MKYVFVYLCLIGSLISVNKVKAEPPVSLAPPLEQQQAMPLKHPSAENLYSIVESELFEDGQWQRRIYTSIRINDLTAARDYGRISITYNHYYTDLTLEFANTINKNGEREALADDAIQTRVTGGGQDFYSDRSELVFSLPDIAPGSVVEFQYLKTSKILPFPGLYYEVGAPFWYQNTVGQDGWRADYIHNYVQRITTPKDLPLHISYFSGYPKPKKQTNNGERTTREWQIKNLDGVVSESYMPMARTVMPTAYFSTIKNWQMMDVWAWQKIEQKLVPTKALRDAVDSLQLPVNASREEKIKAVYAYLQNNVRYVFAHLGRGGYEPHEPDEVLKNSYGDCKDQAVLTVAMLRLLGVEAYPALVETARSGESYAELVALMFDHMIVYVPPQEGAATNWLDTTADRALYPGTSAYLAGQNAFIVDGKGGQLTHFPLTHNNVGIINISTYREANNHTIANVELKPVGSFEQNIRNWWKHTKDKENSLSQFLKALYNNASSDNITGEVLNEDALFEPLVIKARYDFPPDAEVSGVVFGASIHQLFRAYANLNDLPLPDTRKVAFVDKYPYQLKLNVSMQAVNDSSPAVIKTVDDISSPYLSLSHQGRITDEGYKLNIEFTRNPLELSVSEYKAFYQVAEQVAKVDAWLVNMIPDQAKKDETQLQVVKGKHGDQSAEYYIGLARKLMGDGDFTDALTPAEKAVAIKEDSGEAWYVLATVQGLNTLIDEAEKSFERAADLGYFPN